MKSKYDEKAYNYFKQASPNGIIKRIANLMSEVAILKEEVHYLREELRKRKYGRK